MKPTAGGRRTSGSRGGNGGRAMTEAALPAWHKEAEAHKRAMPLQRLAGNGMDYADVVELYARVDRGQPWAEAAGVLGDRNSARAEQALTAGHLATARGWHLLAAACYRVGQVPLADDDPGKTDLYRRLIDQYGRAGVLFDPAVERIEVDYAGGALCGWLLRPATARTTGGPPPVVIVMGGFDGWREEYHVGATYLLERGIAALLVDGPGQGESRSFHGLHLDPSVDEAFSAIVDHLWADDRLAQIVGIWGNSMGGYLAALAAATDDRIDACCVNGGTTRPAEILDRYPGFITKIMPLLGVHAPERARAALARFELTPELLDRLRCPLLVLHGTPDQVFLIENARALFDAAASTNKTFREWPDGDHCITNHSHEKHVVLADWFADQLLAPSPASSTYSDEAPTGSTDLTHSGRTAQR